MGIGGAGIDTRSHGGYVVLPLPGNGREWLRPLIGETASCAATAGAGVARCRIEKGAVDAGAAGACAARGARSAVIRSMGAEEGAGGA